MRYLVLIIAFVFFSCGNSYEKEECQAIEDITNDFIIREHWNKTINTSFVVLGKKYPRPVIDSLNFDVVVCDTLSAFSEISSKKRFVFDNNRYNGAEQEMLKKIMRQQQFERLSSRGISVKSTELPKHYRNVERLDLKDGDFYLNLKFSRICFDETMENGLVIVDMGMGVHGKSKYKFLSEPDKNITTTELTLIKKVDGKWKMVENNEALAQQ
jgi:hypothetical protein